eukprot:6693808-Prymnesium_polylepis.1
MNGSVKGTSWVEPGEAEGPLAPVASNPYGLYELRCELRSCERLSVTPSLPGDRREVASEDGAYPALTRRNYPLAIALRGPRGVCGGGVNVNKVERSSHQHFRAVAHILPPGSRQRRPAR